MNISSISKKKCTACGACKVLCPQKSIRMINDDYDNVYPTVDMDSCVECGLCLKVCPAENDVVKNQPIKAFAAWSTDNTVRKTAASGGVASAIYKYYQSKGYLCYGVKNNGNSCSFVKAQNNEDASLVFRNSKYVYTEVGEVLEDIVYSLRRGKKVCCIGLPCQIAAIKNAIGNKYEDSIILVDLLCHGVSAYEYLRQHVSSISPEVSGISFRDARFGTEKYYFSINCGQETIYSKTAAMGDEYQLGYHKGITYRENCYFCKYSTKNRVADLMLADYWLLGKMYPFEHDKSNVNLVYACTEKGLISFSEMCTSSYIEAYERPIDESVKVQGQLNKPTPDSYRSRKFRRIYKKTKNFNKAIHKAMYWDIKLMGKKSYSILLMIRRVMRKVFKVEI